MYEKNQRTFPASCGILSFCSEAVSDDQRAFALAQRALLSLAPSIPVLARPCPPAEAALGMRANEGKLALEGLGQVASALPGKVPQVLVRVVKQRREMCGQLVGVTFEVLHLDDRVGRQELCDIRRPGVDWEGALKSQGNRTRSAASGQKLVGGLDLGGKAEGAAGCCSC